MQQCRLRRFGKEHHARQFFKVRIARQQLGLTMLRRGVNDGSN
jgi:hypothetical protein